MRWHKEGVCENLGVIAHPGNTDAWKALDAFVSNIAAEVRNVCLGLATDGFSPFKSNCTVVPMLARLCCSIQPSVGYLYEI
jgi:hypothetical protein